MAISEENLNNKINELNLVNTKLLDSEKSLQETNEELNNLNKSLMAINESLGIEDGGIFDQLNAIKAKNQELEKLNQELLLSQKETQETLNLLDNLERSKSALRNDEKLIGNAKN